MSKKFPNKDQSSATRDDIYSSSYENSQAYKEYMGTIENIVNDQKPENIKQSIEDIKKVMNECVK